MHELLAPGCMDVAAAPDFAAARPPAADAPAPAKSGTFAPPPKLYRIGEVMAATGLSRQTLHNYTTMGLIREARWTDGGHRLYGEDVFDRLARIVQLRTTHRLEDIRDLLGPPAGPSPGGPP